jgi:Na+-translocating ferredoxin:NAD+ oxidoreductase subunit B
MSMEMLSAIINENLCIGCGICLAKCPFDAIIGAAGQLHTVLVNECIGCKLCIDPCPVDCIDLLPTTDLLPDELINKKQMVANAKSRRTSKLKRIESTTNITLVASDLAKLELDKILQSKNKS